MRTFETTVYQYDELSNVAKKKALDWGVEFVSRTSETSEWMKVHLSETGLPTELEWSLNSCQGDGVAFYGDIDDLTKLLASMKKLSKYRRLRTYDGWNVSVEIVRNSAGHHYSHAHTMNVEIAWRYLTDADPTDTQLVLMDDLHADVLKYVQDMSHQLAKDGYADIEYQTSEEQIVEMFEANEFEFDINGCNV